jgi:hypothetical protein
MLEVAVSSPVIRTTFVPSIFFIHHLLHSSCLFCQQNFPVLGPPHLLYFVANLSLFSPLLLHHGLANKSLQMCRIGWLRFKHAKNFLLKRRLRKKLSYAAHNRNDQVQGKHIFSTVGKFSCTCVISMLVVLVSTILSLCSLV